MKTNNIKEITQNALCSACGACSGICPVNAITMRYNTAGYLFADVDDSKCILCGKCNNVCPSNCKNHINEEFNDIFHGYCINGYIGYATDVSIREQSQSGGIVTALLCYMLEKSMVDGAIVNNFNIHNKRPQAKLAKTKKDIILGCGSYYSQSSVVETLLKNREEKIAAVTLGCQSESLKLIKEKYPNIKLPEYTIGLVCAGQNSGYIIDDLLKEAKCSNQDEILRFRFRDKTQGGWPGNVTFSTSNNSYILDKSKRLNLKAIYEHYRCILCYDQMNIFSDLVVGDPWGITGEQSKEGVSIVITRTKKGEKLIADAVRDGVINLDLIPIHSIINGQTIDNRAKTKCFASLEISKKNNWLLPYNDKIFENIKYKPASFRTKRNIIRRMKYTRQLNLSNNSKIIANLFRKRKLTVKINKIINKPFNFIKRCIRYFLRQLHKN